MTATQAPVLTGPAAGGPVLRTARSAVFAASSVALAVTAHRLGGGMQPSYPVAFAAALVLFGFGLVWARRERGGPAITVAVLTSQLALHLVFALVPTRTMTDDGASSELNRWAAMLLCHDAAHPATAAQVNAARAALGLGPLPTAQMTGMHTTTMHMASPFTAGGAGMLAMHLSAAIVMAWWLRRGERAVWAAARRVVAIVSAAGRHLPPLPRSSSAPRAVGNVWMPRRWTWRTGLAGRGPPAGFVSVLTA